MNSLFNLSLRLSLVGIFAGFSLAHADGKLKACREDLQSHCKDVKKGHGKKIECLKAVPDLKPDCKTALDALEKRKEEFKKERKELAKETREACKTDVESHCKDVEPGDGRIRDCLAEKKTVVSEGCRISLDKKEKHKSERKIEMKDSIKIKDDLGLDKTNIKIEDK